MNRLHRQESRQPLHAAALQLAQLEPQEHHALHFADGRRRRRSHQRRAVIARKLGASPPSIVAYLGDVNVQFPDNLLWKRRTLCLDSQGFLLLSAVQGVTAARGSREKQAGAIKRYHLSDFRTPYTPEMEVQELPNSVCLDFIDGSGLQIACEDRAGQLNVLHSELTFPLSSHIYRKYRC